MTRALYKAIAITLAGILALVLIGLLCFPVYSFLSSSIPPDSASVLVVEGWLPNEALEKAKEEFSGNDYDLLITTGLVKNTGYLIGSGGKVAFDISGNLPHAADGVYMITFLLRGSPVKGVYPHVTLFADSTELGDSYVSKRQKALTYEFRNANPPLNISIVFDNDVYTAKQDRNLFVYSVSVNNMEFPVNSTKVGFYMESHGIYKLNHRMNTSNATEAADFFKAAGIPDSLVVPIETRRKIKSKTYTTALDVKSWLDENRHNRYKFLTVFTQGPHARRSYISFRKAFAGSVEVGVISLPAKDFSADTWYRTKTGWETILYELVGVIYASLVL